MGIRILHTPLNIANDAWSMSRAEREVGNRSTLAVLQQNRFAESADLDLGFSGVDARVRPLVRRIRKTALALSAPWRYDLIVYEYGTSILDFRDRGLDLLDMKLAHRGHAVVAVVFHGCDVRAAGGACSFCPSPCDAARVSRRLAIIRSVADLMYVKTPDLLEVVPEATYLPQAVYEPGGAVVRPPRMSGPLRVVHAPSNPELKGTKHVIAAVEGLKAQGVDIQLQLIQGMPHADALAAYRDADVAVDQMYAGWYGVFAIELMAMGKPVVCRIDSRALSRSGIDDLPIIPANPQSLQDTLLRLSAQRPMLAQAGRRSREFVLAHHDARLLVTRLLSDYGRIRKGDPT